MVSISSSQIAQMLLYMTQGTTITTANNNTANTSGNVFDTSTNKGWGAQAFINTNTNSALFSYTKQTSTGNTFTGSNGQALSSDAALAFSEMSLNTIDGKNGDADGKVSVAEFNKSSSSNYGATIDTDKDGFINRSEYTAFNMLTDQLDGSQDGKINASYSSTLFGVISAMAPQTIKSALQANQEKIKDADENFTMEMPKVDGSNGSYDNTTALGKYANNGEAAAKLAKSGQLLYNDFEYADTSDLNTGLASMTALQKAQDRNGDGKVSVYENKLAGGNSVDINNDGYISAGEFLAEVMTADKNGDGKITFTERLQAQKAAKETGFADSVKATYTNKNIASVENDFEMPNKTTGTGSTSNTNATMLQMFLKLLLQMFGCSI